MIRSASRATVTPPADLPGHRCVHFLPFLLSRSLGSPTCHRSLPPPCAPASMSLPLLWYLVRVFFLSHKLAEAPSGGASQRRDVAGGNWEHASQAPSPGPSPSPSPSPQPPKRENDVLRACHPKKKTGFYEHVMCVVFCVALSADLAEQTSTVAMSSQATYTARGLRQPRPPLRGHIFLL